TGLGMLLIGSLSDAFKPHFGDEGIRFALLAVVPLMMCVAFCYLLASRNLQDCLDRVTAYAKRAG
ncbi:MAG: hypothetical protein ABW049_10280, partial [Spongiibacteraceae bacterium]